MEFPREATFTLESVTYKAILVKKDDIPVAASATSACIVCGGALGADAFYKTDPDIFQVHAKCAMEYAEQRAATRSDSNNSDSLLTSSHSQRYCRAATTHRSYAASPFQQPQHLQGLVNPMNHNYSQAYPYPPQHLQQQYPPYPYPYSFPPPQQQYPQYPTGHYYPPYTYPYSSPPQQQQYPQYLGSPIVHYYPHHPPPQQQQHSHGSWNLLGYALVEFSSLLFQGLLGGFLS